MLRVANSSYGIQFARISSEREQLMLMKFDDNACSKIWTFEGDAGIAGRESFDTNLSLYVARDHPYAEAHAHPLTRGILVVDENGPRMVAEVDMKIVAEYFRDLSVRQAAARHFDLLRQAYPVKDWWGSKTTCWIRLVPDYDIQHIEALTGARESEIREGQVAYLQLTYRDYSVDRLQVWEPQVLVTLDRAPC